jgi:hypothetical protein
MKYVLVIAALAALGGCATQQPGPAIYGTRSAQYVQPADPHQWHVVSVTDVNLPPGTERPANVTSEPLPAPSAAQPSVAYTQPYQPGVAYGTAPVIVQQPIYAAPVVVEDPYYYYPPVSLSLGFMFGSGGWHHGGRGYGGLRWSPRFHGHHR